MPESTLRTQEIIRGWVGGVGGGGGGSCLCSRGIESGSAVTASLLLYFCFAGFPFIVPSLLVQTGWDFLVCLKD